MADNTKVKLTLTDDSGKIVRGMTFPPRATILALERRRRKTSSQAASARARRTRPQPTQAGPAGGYSLTATGAGNTALFDTTANNGDGLCVGARILGDGCTGGGFARLLRPAPERPDDPECSQYVAGRHHILLAQKLMAIEAGSCRRLVVTMPPRHGKSELATRMRPAWFMGRRPQRQVIVGAYNAAHRQKGLGVVHQRRHDPPDAGRGHRHRPHQVARRRSGWPHPQPRLCSTRAGRRMGDY